MSEVNLGFDLNPDLFSLPLAEVLSAQDWQVVRRFGGEEFIRELAHSPISLNDLMSLTPNELISFGMDGNFLDAPMAKTVPSYLQDLLKETFGETQFNLLFQTNVSLRQLSNLLKEDFRTTIVDGKMTWVYVPKELGDK